MARPRTDFRNEIKSRVRDGTYEALMQYMQDHRCSSEARAISDLLELALFGVIGTVPPQLGDFRHEAAQSGTKTQS